MKTDPGRTTQTSEDVLNELRSLVSEAEKILGQPTHENRAESTIAALQERLEAAQERLAHAYQTTSRRVVAGARYADHTIRDHPYQSIAIALGVGVLAGLLISRRGHHPAP